MWFTSLGTSARIHYIKIGGFGIKMTHNNFSYCKCKKRLSRDTIFWHTKTMKNDLF